MTRPTRRMLSSLWSATTMVPVNSGAAAAYRTLFVTVRRLVLGRRVTVRLDDGDLTLTVTRVDSRLDVHGLSVGQLTDVRVEVSDIRWQGGVLNNATLILHKVHVRPGAPPLVVAAPVEVTLEVPAPMVDDMFGRAAPRLAGGVGEDGVARIRFARRPRLGHVEVDVSVDGSTLWLQAHTVALGARRWRLPARTPAYPVRLPELAHGLTLTGVEFAPQVVRVTGTLPQWRAELDRKRLEDTVTGLSVGMVLNLTRLGRSR